jgi:hypothetical protein
MADLTLDWNLADSSGGKNAPPVDVVSMLLQSVSSHSGEVTSWWIIDGTSAKLVTFHLLSGQRCVHNRKDTIQSRKRTHFGISFSVSFTSHLGMMMRVHGAPNGRKQNTLNPKLW